MITVVTNRFTVEDKSLDPPEIYREDVIRDVRVFGLLVHRQVDHYECEERPGVEHVNKIGFKR